MIATPNKNDGKCQNSGSTAFPSESLATRLFKFAKNKSIKRNIKIDKKIGSGCAKNATGCKVKNAISMT